MIYTTELNYVHADDEDLGSASASLDASVTVGTACNFSGNVDIPHTSTIMNGVNSTDIGKTTLNVTCNDQGGYAVYAIGYTNDEYGNTSLKSSISDDYNIPTGTSTSGDTSNWSMKLSTVPGTTTATIENGYDNYHTVPDDFTKVATLNTITNPGSSTTGSSISTTYQAYISPTQPAGTYSGKVKYTLVHPSTAPAPEKPIFMQDTATIKSKLVNVGDEIQAIDTRDGKKYWITKMADGNIWMTQNLDLELNSNKTYTPADTDISANWQPIRNTIDFTGTSMRSWANDYNTPYSANPGEVYYYTSSTTTDDYKYTSLIACQTEHPDCSAHNHAGNYYNWSAAVASNNTNTTELTTQFNNAPESICPAGWKLPTGRQTDNNPLEGNELGTVLYNHGILGNAQSSGGTHVYYNYTDGGFNKTRTTPLWLARSGLIFEGSLDCPAYIGNYCSSYDFEGSLDDAGHYGNYWSNTIHDNSTAYNLNFGSNNVFPSNYYGRGFGYSVRCLVK